jgi:hypothetical protein
MQHRRNIADNHRQPVLGRLEESSRRARPAPPATPAMEDRVPTPSLERLLPAITIGLTLVLCLTVPAAPARAQDDAPADSTEPLTASSSSEDVAARVEGMNEQLQTLITDVDKLKKIKFSGYAQLRYEVSEADNDSVRVSGNPATITPTNVERFYLRRSRFKLTYDHAPWSQFVLYVDAGADRQVRMLEAYAALTDPRTTDPRHQLWLGQFNVPFGYEIERSSSLREVPERTRMENVLFPGERDRGVKLMSLWGTHLETVLAVLNGGGIGSTEFPATDPSRAKDFLGRVRGLFGVADVAVSGYAGKAVVPFTGPDVTLARTRVGVDAQAYYELARFGGGTVRGEYWAGHQVNADSVNALSQRPTNATPVTLPLTGTNLNHFATDFAGGYVMWVQNLGPRVQVAGRWERFDPNVDVEHDQFERWNAALHWFYAGLTRLTVSYEIPRTERADGAGGFVDPKDNLWTLQFQHTFP